MKTKILSTAILLTLLACSKQGDAPLGTVDPNTNGTAERSELRLVRLAEPMVWGGNYHDPLLDSVVPGLRYRDTVFAKGEVERWCPDSTSSQWWTDYRFTPIYEDRDSFLKRVRFFSDEVEMLNPGKLMVFEHWTFATDVNRGVHIFDDSDPANPRKVGFIQIPGVLDIALKNNTLLANAYSALLAIDIQIPAQARVTHMLPHAFPPVHSSYGPVMDSTGGVISHWRQDTVEVCGPQYMIMAYAAEGSMGAGTSVDKAVPTSEAKLGTNSSLSRFNVSAEWLYAVDDSHLRLFDIRKESTPLADTAIATGTWDLETIFRDGTSLFLGSMTGMIIYDHAKGAVPVKASTYSHITSCDPVVVQEGIAYVTLRSGTRCANGKNELNVIDVTDIYKPTLLAEFPMKNPAGLAVADDQLFVCEGSSGLAVLDIQNPKNPKEKARYEEITAEDAIAQGGILTLIGPAGVWRMDYQDSQKLSLLSFSKATVLAVPYQSE